MADIAPPLATTGSFYRARIASLLAIAPLGIWTALHLWDNLSAFAGAQAVHVVAEHGVQEVLALGAADVERAARQGHEAGPLAARAVLALDLHARLHRMAHPVEFTP